MKLDAKVVLVTGASRGIGHALARTLAEEGAHLVLTARSRAPLEALGRALAGSGARAVTVVGDVGSDEDAARMAAAATEAFGRVDVLVNNAAVLLERAPIPRLPAAHWEETLRVNVGGVANMLRRVVPGMERRGEGVVINVSSGWGRFAAADVGPYCASKFAVEAITQTLAEEVRPGILVFALNPGVIATEMLGTAFGTDVSAYTAPEDLAPRWRRLFAAVEPAWHGTSRDL